MFCTPSLAACVAACCHAYLVYLEIALSPFTVTVPIAIFLTTVEAKCTKYAYNVTAVDTLYVYVTKYLLFRCDTDECNV